VLGEITAALEWLFDDGIEDERDAQLRSVSEAHRDAPESQDALAVELEDFAALAEQHREALAAMEAFDPAMIDEARTLAAALRERSATQADADSQRNALQRRTRIAALLQTKRNRVRAAVRYVFRHDPSLVREVTSAYERHRRAQARRRQGQTGTPTPTPEA
jgi:hypothetical protein